MLVVVGQPDEASINSPDPQFKAFQDQAVVQRCRTCIIAYFWHTYE